jgi:hypothetical protein
MLKDVYLEDIDSRGYTAVFVVPTPAVKHSGISHLAEHLCFRGSSQYPAPHELFVFNTLLPANINASTESGYTYFYVCADDRAVFKRGVGYLYSGLAECDYGNKTIAAERDGVIFNELQMYECNKEYKLASAIWRGDCSENAYQHAGGFSDTIGHIQPKDVLAYKKYWYHPSKIQLLISGANVTELEGTIQELQTMALASPPKDLVQPNEAEEPFNLLSSEDNRRVYSWWIAWQYLHDILTHEEQIAAFAKPFGQLIIDDDVNTAGLFAIRLVSECELATCQKALTDFMVNLAISSKNAVQTRSKHPAEVTRLIQAFKHRNITPKAKAKPLEFYLSHVVTSQLNEIRHITKSAEEFDCQNIESRIALQLQDRLSLANICPLPNLYTAMVNKRDLSTPFCIEGAHWLYTLEGVNKQQLVSLFCSAVFWAPRITGDCYAMGVGHYQGKFFIYGAQDNKAQEREAYWRKVLSDHGVYTLSS